MTDQESSPGQNTSVATATDAQVSDASPAASSTADTNSGAPASMLDAVTAALHPEPAEGSPPSEPKDPSANPPADDAGKPPASDDELTEEDKAGLKDKTRRSFERLTSKNRELTTQLETANSKAAEYDKVVNFIKSTNLAPDDLDAGFEIMRLMKNDRPHEAWALLEPIVTTLQRMVGQVLPPDLQEQVRLGYLTESHAREIASSRSREASTQRREKRSAEEAEASQQQEQVRAIVSAVSTAATQWETAKQTSDPDWNLKSERVRELAELDVYKNGYPRTTKDAVERFERIYDQVTKEIGKFRPKPSAKQPVTGQASTRTAAEPGSMLEAVRAGLRKTG